MPNIIVNNYIKYQYICFLHHFLNKLYLRLTLRKIKNQTKLRNIKQKIQTFTFHPLSVILQVDQYNTLLTLKLKCLLFYIQDPV